MLQKQAKNIRSHLRLTASALVLATAWAGMAVGANAATTVTSGSSYYIYDGTAADTSGITYEVTSGTTAYVTANYVYLYGNATSYPDFFSVYNGTDPVLMWTSANLSADAATSMSGNLGASVIQVDSGATLYIDNEWWWESFQSMIKSAGDIVINHGTTYFLGTNTMTGDLDIGTSTIYFGASWVNGYTTFGTGTDIVMGAGSSIYSYESSSIDNVINTISSADSTASITLYSGLLTVDGVNTTTSSYSGTLTVTSGATFTVGDATHSSAVFGDPTNSAAIINVAQSSGSLGILQGYGTIYGTVNNSGIVKPGGTSGTFGTLTIVGDYTQSSTGELKVEVSPTSVSTLVVDGTATLDGSMIIVVDSGTYGNGVYTVLKADSISGSFSSVTTSGSADGVLVALNTTSTTVSLVTEKASQAQIFGNGVMANRDLIGSFSRAVFDKIEIGVPAAGDKSAKEGDIEVWLQPFMRDDNFGRDGDGYDAQSGGVVGGAEYHFGGLNAVVGGAFSYAHTALGTKNEDNNASMDSYNLAIYGGADMQYARVDGMVYYNGYTFSATRNLGSYGTTKMTPSGYAWGAAVQVSRNLFDNLVTPFARGLYTRTGLNEETETGAEALALTFNTFKQNSFVGDIGLRVHALTPTPELKMKLEFTASVGHDFTPGHQVTTGGFANSTGSDFTYTWKTKGANMLMVGTEFSGEVLDGLELYGRINGQFTTTERAGELSIGGRYRF